MSAIISSVLAARICRLVVHVLRHYTRKPRTLAISTGMGEVGAPGTKRSNDAAALAAFSARRTQGGLEVLRKCILVWF